MSIDIEGQYDKLYRYCYFKLHNREMAEDITQEAFLRYFERYNRLTEISALKCLYTIARNLCIDEYRKPQTQPIDSFISDDSMEERLITNLTVREALSKLTHREQELLLLRYANDVPVTVIGKIYGISRFAVYRQLTAAANKFREELGKEDSHGSLER